MPKISDSMARATFAALRGLAPLPRGHGYATRLVPRPLRARSSGIYRVGNGIRMRLDPSVKMEFEMLTGAYEKRHVRLVRLLLRPGDTVFDIGANVGYYSLIARTLVGESGAVHSFEPHPAIFARLQENIALSHYTNVVAHQLAVADMPGTVTLYSPDTPEQNSGWSSLFLPADLEEAEWPDDPTRIEVAADTLDSLVFEQGLPMPQFVKLDVERAEVRVLEGMGRLLASAQPPAVLCEEQDELTEVGLRSNEVRLRFAELGYRIYEIDWRGRPVPSSPHKPRATHLGDSSRHVSPHSSGAGAMADNLERRRPGSGCSHPGTAPPPSPLLEESGRGLQCWRGSVPRVSIIIPAWNYARYLRECLDSVLAQTHDDVEIIVVDNGSTDDTRQVAASYQERIVYRYQEHEPSWMVGINRAMSVATGTYFKILPADDLLLPSSLERCVEALEEYPSAAFAFSPTVTFTGSASGRRWRRNGPTPGDAYVMPGHDFVQSVLLCKRPNPDPASVLFRTSAVPEVGPFDEENTGVSDFDMYCRLGLRHDVCFLDQPTALHRIHLFTSAYHAENATMHVDQFLRMVRRLMEDPHCPQHLRRQRRAIISCASWHIAISFLLDFRRPRAALRYGWDGLRASPLGFAFAATRWTGIVLQHRLARL